MSTLSLIRHGQAKFFQAEEGVLSPLGEAQAARLAHFWLKHRIHFDEVHTGSLVRHLQTERVVAECFRRAGEPWPAATEDPAWNEYDFPGVFTHLVPGDSRLTALAEEFAQARGGPQENRKFHRVLKEAMSCWLDENCQVEGVEPWPAFRDRVSGAIRGLMAGPSGRRVVVFTSGGPGGPRGGANVHVRPSVGSEKSVPEEVNHREIAVRVQMVDEVKLLLAPEPSEACEARSLDVVFLV